MNGHLLDLCSYIGRVEGGGEKERNKKKESERDGKEGREKERRGRFTFDQNQSSALQLIMGKRIPLYL